MNFVGFDIDQIIANNIIPASMLTVLFEDGGWFVADTSSNGFQDKKCDSIQALIILSEEDDEEDDDEEDDDDDERWRIRERERNDEDSHSYK